MALETRIELTVNEDEIDDLGHVNNARFLDYFERGRRAWYNRCDATLLEPSGRHLGTVVVNININYRRECFAGEVLSVTTRPARRGQRSFVLAQEIVNDDGVVVADASVTSVVMDMHVRQVVPLPESLAIQFDR